MSPIANLVGGILPYLVVASFLAMTLQRLRTWSKLSQPGKLTLYPTTGWDTRQAVKEALFFPSLFAGDRLLWALAWSFHAALALALLGHLRVVTGLIDAMFRTLGLDTARIDQLSSIAGGFAGVTLMLAAGALLLRRVSIPRVREISSGPDFLALLLLLAVIVSGNSMRFGSTAVDLEQTRRWALSLVRLSPEVPTNPSVVLHLLCAECLVLYLPLSKLMHFGGLFYSLSLVRRS